MVLGGSRVLFTQPLQWRHHGRLPKLQRVSHLARVPQSSPASQACPGTSGRRAAQISVPSSQHAEALPLELVVSRELVQDS